MRSNRIGDAVRRRRLTYGLSQAEIGSMLDLSQSQVSAIELGRIVPSGDLLADIAIGLDLPHLLEQSEDWEDE